MSILQSLAGMGDMTEQGKMQILLWIYSSSMICIQLLHFWF